MCLLAICYLKLVFSRLQLFMLSMMNCYLLSGISPWQRKMAPIDPKKKERKMAPRRAYLNLFLISTLNSLLEISIDCCLFNDNAEIRKKVLD